MGTEEFWGRWVKEVFPELLKQRKWAKDKRDVKVGDIVLRKDETAAGHTYKYARVIKVHVGTDGKVMSPDIEYRLPGETKYCTTTRPIHKMVPIVPVEEQARESNEEEVKAAEPRIQNPEAAYERKAQGTKLNESLQPKNVAKDNPPGREEVKGRLVQKVKHKKINPRKKAGKQTSTIVVKIPAKSEEVKDVGAAVRRKRGRPKKVLGMNPLDPRKGSVPYPGKGVCADPRSGDATFGVGGTGPQHQTMSVS